MRKTLTAAAAGLILFQTGNVHAQHWTQAATRPIRRDAFVRVMVQPNPRWQQGRVLSIDSTRFIMELAEPGRPLLAVPLASLDSLERRYSVGAASRALPGAALGTLAGGLAFGVIGLLANMGNTSGDGGNFGFLLAIPGSMVGAVAGLIVGMGTAEKRWAPVGLRPPSAPPARN